MRKSSRRPVRNHRELQVVGLQYGVVCRMDFRGRTEMNRVGFAGNRTRYQSGVYDSTCESGHYVKMSGTAIIRNYYRLRS